MSLITRILPPDAKNTKLTFQDMDNNLYYLQSLGVSGLTFSANTLTITNPTGGTKSVNIASDTNTFITAATYNDLTNTITLTDNANTSFNVYIDSVSGLTVNGTLSATTISGGTLYGNGSNLTGISTQDTFVTGGTYSNGDAIFTNNTGGTFNVTGFTTGNTLQQVLVNGNISNGNNIIMSESDNIIFKYAGYNNNINTNTLTSNRVILFPDNSGTVALLSDIQTFTGGTVTGTTNFTNGLSATTISATTYQNLPLDITITGGTYSAGTITLLNNTGGTVSISGLSTGYTYSQVNNYTSLVPITITHNLNTTEILIQIIDTNTNQLILGSVSNYQLNSVDVTLSSSLNGIKVVIVGGYLSSATPRGKINLLFGHDSVSPLDSTTYYIGGQFNLAPTTSASDGRRLISPVTGYITQVSISETVGGTLGSSEPSTFTIENVTQSTSSTITTTATYDSSSSLQNYILSSPLYVVNGDRLEIRWITPVWGPNPTTVRQQINVLIDF